MKKLFSIIFLVALTLGTVALSAIDAGAQVTMTQTDPAGASATVNTNADTSYHLIQLAGQTNNFALINFVVKGTKTSGTVGGSASLWGSNDNSRWFAVYTQTNASTADTTHSQTLANSDNDLCFVAKGTGSATTWRYYRIRVITTGTQVSSYVCTALGRKVAN